MRKNIFLILLSIISLFFLNYEISKSAEKSDVPLSFGIYGGVNFNFHTPDFQYRDSLRNYYKFDNNVQSTGLNIGLISLFPINNKFTLSVRLGYNSMNSIFDETSFFDSLLLFNGNRISANVSQYFTSNVSYIELTPVLHIHNLLPIKDLYFLAGLEFGIPVQMRYSFKKTTESIDKLYYNEEYLANDAAIPDAGVRSAFTFGAGYMFHVTPNICLTPEVSYRIPINFVSANSLLKTWSISQFRAGLNLTFSFDRKKEEPVKPMKKSNLNVRIKEVRTIDSKGMPSSIRSIKVEDVQYTELFPLVPYVFMPVNDSKPTEKTQVMAEKSESGEYSIEKLDANAISINKSTLDIIGTRLKENPGSEITITGTTDNKTEIRKLALDRAEFGKKYLIDNYKINEERINIRTTPLPEKPSALSVEEGLEENRRIEFSSSNPKILEPIIMDFENQRIAEPNQIEFVPDVESTDSITNWKMEISQSDRILRKNTGTDYPPLILQWTIQPNELTNKQIPIDYSLTVQNEAGLSKTASGSIPVEYLTSKVKRRDDMPDKTLSKFSLVLFDFDKSDVSDADRLILDKYIIPAIKFNSTVKIYGYTDKIGDEEYNRKLAERRALAVKDAILEKIPSANIEVIAVGEDVEIFDNANPIGRHLSRTVQVHVSTPK